jgi:hypothetical protein
MFHKDLRKEKTMRDKKYIYCTIPIEFPVEIQNANNVIISDEVIQNAMSTIENAPVVLGYNQVIGVIKENVDGFNNAILWGKLVPEITILEKHTDENGIEIIDKFNINAVNISF